MASDPLGSGQRHSVDAAVLLHWYLDAAAKARSQGTDAHTYPHGHRTSLGFTHSEDSGADRDTATNPHSMVSAHAHAYAGCYTHRHADGHGHPGPDRHGNADSHSDTHTYGNASRHRHPDGNADRNTGTNSDIDCDVYSNRDPCAHRGTNRDAHRDHDIDDHPHGEHHSDGGILNGNQTDHKGALSGSYTPAETTLRSHWHRRT